MIDQADHIRSYFHAVDGRINTIHDKAEFSTWKRELQFELEDIYNRTYDKFIWSTLTILDQGFNGWRDENRIMTYTEAYWPFRKILIDIIHPKLIAFKMIWEGRQCHKKVLRFL